MGDTKLEEAICDSIVGVSRAYPYPVLAWELAIVDGRLVGKLSALSPSRIVSHAIYAPLSEAPGEILKAATALAVAAGFRDKRNGAAEAKPA